MILRLANHCFARGFFLATLSILLTAQSGEAQTAAPVPMLTAVSLPAANERERLFAELQKDVAAMDRELGIYKRVVQLVAPSVVHVQAKPLAEYRFRREVEDAGSGVLVKYGERTYVLTNRHVVKHSDIENITLELNDGRQISPKQVLMDQDTDVAILLVDAIDLVPARVGDSDKMEIGDVVMAFGNPFNLRQSVSRGIISGKGRTNLDLGDGGVDYQNFMQTDAAINPGNSGGPLVNMRGEVIGLNTAIASNSGGNDGIGFSIPINIAVSVMRQLIETGHLQRGFLGVTLDSFFDARAAQFVGLPRLAGTRVKQVTARSPAAQAGLQADDIILRFDGAPIENDEHLINLVKPSVGRQVELQVFRKGQLLSVQALIGRMEDFTDAVQKTAGPKSR
jgi:serine protease Do